MTRVLLVEDNPELTEMTTIALQGAGYEVQTARDGTTGLEMMLATPPDVALVDIGLPELDGYELAERVRAEPGGDRIYMVALTGHGRADDRARALRAGFDDHAVKPLRRAQIQELLQGARRTERGGVQP